MTILYIAYKYTIHNNQIIIMFKIQNSPIPTEKTIKKPLNNNIVY